jgi:hypothetical protein
MLFKIKNNFISIQTRPFREKITWLCMLFFLSTFISIAQTDSLKIHFRASGDSVVQHEIIETKDTIPYNSKRVKIISGINTGLYLGSIGLLYQTWYKNYPMGNFKTFNDFPEWLQMDKIGHTYTSYMISNINNELWKTTGLERKKRIWVSGMSGAVYQTALEILDGFSTDWGWSWGDIGANFIGSAAFMAQEFAWNEQRIQIKTSFHRKSYADNALNQRSNSLFGRTDAERFLKDYNGQTYWLSANLKSFFPHSNIPNWLQLSFGMGAEGMFGGTENIGKDKDGNINFNRPDIKRYRQWYLSPDIDLTKIKTKKKALRTLLFILNSFKFPMPSLEFSNGGFKWNWIHF